MQTTRSTAGVPQRVLVVDDEEGIRAGIEALLTAGGLVVETASSAEEGVKKSEIQGFDLVLLDLQAARRGRIRMISQLRIGQPPADVVILTGYGTVADAVEAVKRGAVDVIEKPFTPTACSRWSGAASRRGSCGKRWIASAVACGS